MAPKTKSKPSPAKAVAKPAKSERRVAIRRQPALGTVYRLDTGSARKEMHPALVWNVSTSGLSMLSDKALEPGTELHGRLATIDNGATLPIAARVIHLRQLSTGDYIVGAHFDRALTTEEMQPFIGPPPRVWGRGQAVCQHVANVLSVQDRAHL